MSSNVSEPVPILPIQQRISALEARLLSATSDELVDGLQVLFAALPSANAGEAIELRMRAYLLALSGTPAVALRDAVKKILQGTAGLENPKFVPTPPELAKVCRDCSASYSRELEHLRRVAETSFSRPAFTEAPSPETQRRIAVGFQKLSASIDTEALDRRKAG